MSKTFTYSFGNLGSINVVTPDNPQSVNTGSGTYTGYAVTSVSGTFNGQQVTGMFGASAAVQSIRNEIFDNAIFINRTQGANGSSFNGFDVPGIDFSLANGNHINLFQDGTGASALTYNTLDATSRLIAGGSGAATITSTNYATAVAPVAAAPCYCTGTRILTDRGEVAVEDLSIGDIVLTVTCRPRPIKWIGRRAYPGLTALKHDRPVRIRASALADSVPTRDLLVSPDHCLWLDGLLVAAGHLVNGTSVTRGEAVADLTYWHVELDSHDMLLAEGAAAESFLAAPGVRAQFDGEGMDDALAGAVPYAKRIEHGLELDALRERLILRAGLSVSPTRFGAVRAWMDRCDGRRVAGWAQDAEHPDAPVCLDVVVDGTVVAMTLAEEYRADIAAAGVGNGRHGFDVDLDEPLSAGIPHVVEVQRSADGLRVCAMEVDAAGAWTPLLAA